MHVSRRHRHRGSANPRIHVFANPQIRKSAGLYNFDRKNGDRWSADPRPCVLTSRRRCRKIRRASTARVPSPGRTWTQLSPVFVHGGLELVCAYGGRKCTRYSIHFQFECFIVGLFVHWLDCTCTLYVRYRRHRRYRRFTENVTFSSLQLHMWYKGTCVLVCSVIVSHSVYYYTHFMSGGDIRQRVDSRTTVRRVQSTSKSRGRRRTRVY